MYCCYFLFLLRLRPCVFHVPSHCADYSIMLLFIYLFRSTKTWQWNVIFHDFGISFFVCYVSDKVVSFSDSIPMHNVANPNIFYWISFVDLETKKLYDSMLQHELMNLLADHYTVDYNFQQDFFVNFLLKFHTNTSKHQKSKSYT